MSGVRSLTLVLGHVLEVNREGRELTRDKEHMPCPECHNGVTWARAWLRTYIYRIQMLTDDCFSQCLMHPWLSGDPYPPRRAEWVIEGLEELGIAVPNIGRPSADIKMLTDGLHQAARDDPGRVDENVWYEYILEIPIIRAAGLDPKIWGVCQRCQGQATIPKV